MADSAQTNHVYLSGILLASCSFITILLVLPPLFWHLRNSNLSATFLIGWLVISLLFNFINALIWPTDHFDSWYNGVGLCDIEVKIQVAASVGLPASLACILQALAGVLDTERAVLNQTKAQKRRGYAIDLLCCLGFPSLQMLFHYVVQRRRYYIFGIAGCQAAVDSSWLAILLIVVPPAIWTVIAAYFSVLILTRLYRYRLSFGSILACRNTTKSRFVRLYLLCLVWISCSIVITSYTLYRNIVGGWTSYSWFKTHTAQNWNEIIMVRSNGHVFYDQWVSLGLGMIVFLFFGIGKEAVKMYRSGLIAIGLGKVFPCLQKGHNNIAETSSGSFSSFTSKARMLFHKSSTGSTSTKTSQRTASSTSTENAPIYLKGGSFLSTIPEVSSTNEGQKSIQSPEEGILNVEKTVKSPSTTSLSSCMMSLISAKQLEQAPVQITFDLNDLTRERMSVQSMVTAGAPPSVLADTSRASISGEVVVRKEVRQGSEYAETLPATVYHAR